MSSLIEDYLREVASALRVDAARKKQIVDELRAHLTEQAADLEQTRPGASRADVEREVLARFGNPRDLALAYEPEGAAVLRNQAGEVVLRLGTAVGRGARATARGASVVLKWFAVAVSALLVLTVALGVWGFYEVRPVIEALVEQSLPAYEHLKSCAPSPCDGNVTGDPFFVANDTKSVRLVIRSTTGPPPPGGMDAGSVRVVVADAAGTIVLDRTFTAQDGIETRLAPSEGNWTVSYDYRGFQGDIHVIAYAMNLRLGDL